jgi:hypothetical protein
MSLIVTLLAGILVCGGGMVWYGIILMLYHKWLLLASHGANMFVIMLECVREVSTGHLRNGLEVQLLEWR